MAIVENWFNELHPVVPKICRTTDDNVTLTNLVLVDRQLKEYVITEIVDLSKAHIGHILHDILSMRKLAAQWVLCSLTPDKTR